MKCPRLNVSEISGTFYVVAGIPLCAKSVRNNNEIPCGYPFMREKTCAIIMKGLCDMEFEEMEEEPKKDGRFLKGVLAGIFGTLFVGAAALLFYTNVMGNGLIISPRSGAKEGQKSVLSSSVLEKINELIGYINLYFYEDIETDSLAEGIYSGLMAGVDDKYTEYYTAEEYADLQISATQNYYGIGAALLQDKETMTVTISHVYEGSPAEDAGLKDNDMIVMVEDIEAVSMELSELVTHIRGEEGTTVHLQVYREGETDYLEFDVLRANIDLPTVEYKLLGENIGYIHILDFGAPTIAQFEEAVDELKAQGMQAMLLDVRDNPGGMVNAVTGILDDILPKGTVVYTEDKYGKKQEYTSDDEKQMNYPTAVLINGNSASASEILAGAIRDFEYGTLIGTKTYGKGVVQSIIPLEDGDAIKLTTARYFTPKGENIHGTGIEPEIELEFDYQGDTDKEYDELMDNQVQKAMEVLEKEISAQQ